MRYLPVSPFSSRPSAESSLGALCDFSILQFVEISPSARVPARRSSPSNIVGGNCGFGRARDTILQFIRMTYLLTLIFFVLRLCRCVCLLPFTLQPKKEISSKRKKRNRKRYMNTVVLLFLLLLLIFAYCVRRKEEGTCIGDSVIGFDCYASLFASGVSQRFLQYKAPATFDSGIELLAFLSFSLVLLLVLYKKESSSSRLVMQQWELICFLLLLCYSANVLYRFQLARA